MEGGVMPKPKHEANGYSTYGPNRTALETLIAAREWWSDSDGPLLQQARSLAGAVDANPANHSLAAEYRRTLDVLRGSEQAAEVRNWSEMLKSIADCRVHQDNWELVCGSCVIAFVVDDLGHEEFRGRGGLIQAAISERMHPNRAHRND
jgi:hypothetical protein